MTQLDLFIIIGLLYRHYKKKNLSKSKIGSKILIIVICLIPIRAVMLWNLLSWNLPIYYDKPNNGSTVWVYKLEQNAVAFSINFLPLFYPLWLPYSYGITYVRQEYFPDFSKNLLEKRFAEEDEENCFKKSSCTRYLSGLVENEEFDKYKEMYKDYYMKPRKNRCREAGNYIRNTSFLYNGNDRMVYDDIGEDIALIMKEDNCSALTRKYIYVLSGAKEKEKLKRIFQNICTAENEGKCYSQYFRYALNYLDKEGYTFLNKINQKVCQKFNGFSTFRQKKKYSPPIHPLCKQYLSQ